ncbi:hypothetical protein TNCT_651111 [Trichonephila clavata]|uniref:Uncharacterized protein n=1 Tax=Trichonephila clavata TaxID=2740835 RepID=A0A8X6G938_TRICU|nr:hypothetical protein TNCT_651111 [Trichonephila clavata]
MRAIVATLPSYVYTLPSNIAPLPSSVDNAADVAPLPFRVATLPSSVATLPSSVTTLPSNVVNAADVELAYKEKIVNALTRFAQNKKDKIQQLIDSFKVKGKIGFWGDLVKCSHFIIVYSIRKFLR